MIHDIQQHAWGMSQFLHATPRESLALAQGKAGAASSMHYHAEKNNLFAVHCGVVEIWLYGANAKRMGFPPAVRLRPGETFCVPAGVKHRMVFFTDARLHELYYPAEGRHVRPDDITRLSPDWKSGEREVVSRVPGNYQGVDAQSGGNESTSPAVV